VSSALSAACNSSGHRRQFLPSADRPVYQLDWGRPNQPRRPAGRLGDLGTATTSRPEEAPRHVHHGRRARRRRTRGEQARTPVAPTPTVNRYPAAFVDDSIGFRLAKTLPW